MNHLDSEVPPPLVQTGQPDSTSQPVPSQPEYQSTPQPRGFAAYIGNSFRALTLKDDAFLAIADDPGVIRNTWLLVGIITAFLITVGSMFGFLFGSALAAFYPAAESSPETIGIFAGIVVIPIVFFGLGFYTLFIGFYHLFAKLFGGNSTFRRLWGTDVGVTFAFQLATIPAFILSLIPFIGILITLALMVYSVILFAHLFKSLYALSMGKAVAVVLIPGLIIMILLLLVGFATYSSSAPVV